MTVKHDQESAEVDSEIRERPIFPRLVKEWTPFIAMVGMLFGCYLKFDARMTANEQAFRDVAKDRFNGAMMSQWASDTEKLNKYQWQAADVRAVQRNLRDN